MYKNDRTYGENEISTIRELNADMIIGCDDLHNAPKGDDLRNAIPNASEYAKTITELHDLNVKPTKELLECAHDIVTACKISYKSSLHKSLKDAHTAEEMEAIMYLDEIKIPKEYIKNIGMKRVRK